MKKRGIYIDCLQFAAITKGMVKESKSKTRKREFGHYCGARVGSSLAIQMCSSFSLGAAKTCEFEEVNKVNRCNFCSILVKES